MPRRKRKSTPVIFILIAAAIMVFVDRIVLQGSRPYIQDPPSVTVPIEPELLHEPEPEPEPEIEESLILVPVPEPQKQKEPDDRPRIAIIIDDLGIDKRRSRAVLDLPGPLTAAFLPYASDLEEQTRYALKAGHSLMVHVPMEPMSASADPGPDALLVQIDPDEFDLRLQKNLDAFARYDGINNHMGSRLTTDRKAMDMVMSELAQRGLFFIDSRTTPHSVAEDVARAHGVAFAGRDVFLDHEHTEEFVRSSLLQLEEIAHAHGQAIAIGHPKDETIKALADWLPTLEKKGLRLVHAFELVSVPE